MDGIAWATAFAAAVAASAWLTSRLVGWAGTLGVLDRPNARSSHTRVTPRGGGLAIVTVTAIAALLAGLRHPESAPTLAAILLPALGIAAVSWRDDVRPLPNRVRFAVHLAAAVSVIGVLGPVRGVDAGQFGVLAFGPGAWPLTLLWIVGMTNAFNFMDGVDGIAGLTAAVAGIAAAAVAFASDVPAAGAVAAGFAGGATGFLSCNWPPARIFMGDVGSAFCGFLIAVMPLALPAEAVPAAIAMTAVAMWPFILDTAFTFVRRLIRRENVFESHRSHLYQRLVISGWSHRAAATLYGSLSAVSVGAALAGGWSPGWRAASAAVTATMVICGGLGLVALVHLVERRPKAQARGLDA